MTDLRRTAPAAARNRDSITDVLRRWLPATGTVLEVASGTGEHVVHFARAFPGLTWVPSDPDPDSRASITAWRGEAGPANQRGPLALDASAAGWLLHYADAVVCINMVHISPWRATLGLLAGSARCLPAGGPLILYGPYRQAGVVTAPSNEAFDASLKARDASWGLRTVEEVEAAAHPLFTLEEIAAMPANNLMLLFQRRA